MQYYHHCHHAILLSSKRKHDLLLVQWPRTWPCMISSHPSWFQFALWLYDLYAPGVPGRANVILLPNPKAASATDARPGRPDLDDVGDGGDCTDLPLVLLETRPSLRARCHEATEVQQVCTILIYHDLSCVFVCHGEHCDHLSLSKLSLSFIIHKIIIACLCSSVCNRHRTTITLRAIFCIHDIMWL